MDENPKYIVDKNSFNFLNHTMESEPIKLWNNNELPKLWLYNLHYFNDLKSVDSKERQELLQSLILSWIDQNPPGHGVGWESYPLSIRIVNLVKWQSAQDVVNKKVISSLVLQIRYLESNIEYHLKGNHLFSNAKALVFAGYFFEGPEASKWLKKGMKILCLEVKEQILKDGGMELSTITVPTDCTVVTLTTKMGAIAYGSTGYGQGHGCRNLNREVMGQIDPMQLGEGLVLPDGFSRLIYYAGDDMPNFSGYSKSNFLIDLVSPDIDSTTG